MPKDNEQPSKYDEPVSEELGPNYEQKKWEEEKLGHARWRLGAKDAKEKNKVSVLNLCCVVLCLLCRVVATLWLIFTV